jgi:ABC-type transport system involved in cytochrome c biogenesis permease subunit
LPQAGAALIDKRMTPLYPALDTPWFASHVGLSFLGYGFFAAGLALGIVYLRGGEEAVYRTAGRSALYGFSAFSAGMVCGGIWAYYAWGSYWIWTPKEIWSVIVWIYFATLTHLKFIPAQEGWPGWTKRLEMGATAAGYGVVLLTFLGVSLLLRSSHSF